MIKIEKSILEKIAKCGETAYPEECIGAIFGKISEIEYSTKDGFASGRKVVDDIFEINNSSKEQRERRSLVEPEDFLKADKEANKKNLEIIGWYHSHPNVPAKPSEYDLENALPLYSYLIVSVRNKKTQEIRSWIMEEDRSKFNEEEILVIS
jgi:proteasome lid subunit RPN8/RPN11